MTHIYYYAVMATFLFLGFLAAWQAHYLFMVLPILYFLFAVLHHRAEHTLTPKIVIEYMLIAGMGMSIIAFLFIGGFL